MTPAPLQRVTSPSSHRAEPSASTTASRRRVATVPPSARFDPPTPPSSPPPAQPTSHSISPVPDIDSNYDSGDDEPPPFHHLFTFGGRIRRRQTDDESETPPQPALQRPTPERKESKSASRLRTLGAAARGHSFSPFRRSSADDAFMPELSTVLSAPNQDLGPALPSVPMTKSLSAQSARARPDLPKRAGTLDSPLQLGRGGGSNSSTSPRISDQTDTALIRPTTPPADARPPVSTRRTAPGKLKIPRPSSLITRGTWFDSHVTEPEPVAEKEKDVFHETKRERPRRKKRRFPQATMPPTPSLNSRQGYWTQSNRSSLHSVESPLGEGSSAAGMRSVADRQRRFMGAVAAGPPSPMSQPFQSATEYDFGNSNEKHFAATSSHGDGQLWRFVTCGMGGRGRAKALRARRRVRKEEKPEDWKTRLRKWFIVDGFVTLYIRVVTLACAITSLVLSIQTRALQRDMDLPGIMGASPILSLAFSVATIVHFFAVSHRELTGRPIGLWGMRSKMLWVCLDILFISFWSAYMSSAINDYIATPLECTGMRPWWRNELTDAYSHLIEAIGSANSTVPATPAESISSTLGIILPSIILRSSATRGICHRQAVSIGLGVVTLVLYCFNMVLSLFRIFETVRLSATGVTRSDLV